MTLIAEQPAALDLETCFGAPGKCAAFNVDRLDGSIPNVEIGDALVVDSAEVPTAGQRIAVANHGSPLIGTVARMTGGKLGVVYADGDSEMLANVRVLGVVTGLVRRFN